MAAQLINGKELAAQVLDEVKTKISEQDLRPGLATFIIGNDPASHKYVEIKEQRAREVGINFAKKAFPANFAPEKIIGQMVEANADHAIDGIVVQLPLPNTFKRVEILKHIHPFKDVDGLHPKNLGLLMEGSPQIMSPVIKAINQIIIESGLFPTTTYPLGIQTLTTPDLTGVPIAIIGGGLLVGRPLSIFLGQLEATVTIINEHTQLPEKFLENAKIIITATDAKDVLDPTHVTDRTLVIDVGGDIETNKFIDREIVLSKTPGGVGPLTVAYLLENTVLLAKHNQASKPTKSQADQN